MSHIFHSVITKHSPDLQRPAKSPQPLSREPISLPPPRQDNGNATQVLLLENQFRSTSPTPKCIKLYYNYNHLDFYSGSQRSPIPSQVHFRQAARHQSLSPPGSTNKSVPAYYPSRISSHCTQTQEPRTIKPVHTFNINAHAGNLSQYQIDSYLEVVLPHQAPKHLPRHTRHWASGSKYNQ